MTPSHPRRRRDARPRHRALASLLLALALAACGRDARETTSPPRPPMVTYPVRQVVVAIRPAPAWPSAPTRTLEEARGRARTAYERIRAGEEFARVAAEMSDDAIHGVDDGFVGFVAAHLGDRADFVQAVAALPDGGVTEPIDTDTAVYVLQRLSRAEGMAIEARVTAAVEGFLVQWHDVVPSLPPTQTREEAYAEAAAAAVDLQAQTATLETAMGRILGALPANMGLRRRTITGYEKAAEAFLSVEPGRWAGPVETKDGWMVGRRLPYERFSLSHILVAHRQSPGQWKVDKRTEQEAVVRAEEALARVRQDPASWDAVVREYSDDADSRDRGGRIGDVCNVEAPGRGRLPTEVEEAARKLEPGAISEVVPGRLGVHVLRRDS